MKTLKLEFMDSQGVLSREQMRNVLGGTAHAAEAQVCDCSTSFDCPTEKRFCLACSGSGSLWGYCSA